MHEILREKMQTIESQQSTITSLRQELEDARKDAVRYQSIRFRVGGIALQKQLASNQQYFEFQLPSMITKKCILKGSVAQHFDEHVDLLLEPAITNQQAK